jgi:putative transposase
MEEKKIKGRKRHVATDAQGNILHIKVHAANIHDTIAGVPFLQETFNRHPSLLHVSADSGYRGTTENYVKEIAGKAIEISKKALSGWTVLKKRWVVERTFGWLNGSRRLAKDYEICAKSSENFIRIAHTFLLLRRVATS